MMKPSFFSDGLHLLLDLRKMLQYPLEIFGTYDEEVALTIDDGSAVTPVKFVTRQ